MILISIEPLNYHVMMTDDESDKMIVRFVRMKDVAAITNENEILFYLNKKTLKRLLRIMEDLPKS